MWSEVDSNLQSFEIAGRHAAREILDCISEGHDPRQAGRNAKPNRPAPPMPSARR
ncbi:hypothetical protein [Nocardiopsis valliformis]|uniref:hypothetical protein n=1 Tax=Nocardiopsis valliformis TaxID=239974 RepID=UPI0003469D6C